MEMNIFVIFGAKINTNKTTRYLFGFWQLCFEADILEILQHGKKPMNFVFNASSSLVERKLKKTALFRTATKFWQWTKYNKIPTFQKTQRKFIVLPWLLPLKFNKLINRVKLDGGAAYFLCAVHHGDHGATFLPFHLDIFFQVFMSMWWWSSVCPRVEWFRNLLKSVQWFSEFKSLSSNND